MPERPLPCDKPQEWMVRKIHEAMHEAIEEAREAAIKAAVKDFEQRVRDIAARAVLNVMNFYTIEKMGEYITIRVQIEEPKKNV